MRKVFDKFVSCSKIDSIFNRSITTYKTLDLLIISINYINFNFPTNKTIFYSSLSMIEHIQLPEWEVTQRTPSDALLREASPPTARPHRRPAKGNSKNSPPCQDYKRLRPSLPHHLITRPTPSHRVVWQQSFFFTKHLRMYSTDASDDDSGYGQTRHGTVREEAIFGVKIKFPATNQSATENCTNRLSQTRRRSEPSPPSPSRGQGLTFPILSADDDLSTTPIL